MCYSGLQKELVKKFPQLTVETRFEHNEKVVLQFDDLLFCDEGNELVLRTKPRKCAQDNFSEKVKCTRCKKKTKVTDGYYAC